MKEKKDNKMNYRRQIKPALLLVTLLVLVTNSHTRADVIFSSSGGTATNSQFATYGFQFTPVVDITVDTLGFYDANQNGLLVAHNVGIWSSTGTLLTSASITTANSTLSGPVFNGGQYRFTNVSGPVLSSGATYVFGASIEGALDNWYFGGPNIAFTPALATVSSIGYYTFGDLLFPVNTIGNTYAAGSFEAHAALAAPAGTPEPGGLALIATLAVTGGALMRLRRRKRNL